MLLPKKWTAETYKEFQEGLKALGEDEYKAFNLKLIPGTELVYGIRVPMVRKIAKDILKTDYEEYLKLEKSTYHEEVIIEGLVMAGIKCDYSQMLAYMKKFTDRIYNWAINDTVMFKGIGKHLDKFINDVDWFIFNENPWAQRFGYDHLMSMCLIDEYIDSVLAKVDAINSDFYYVQMMQAWLLATAVAKQRDKTIAYLENNNLNETTLKMTVKKARESFRVSKEDKEYLKSLI